MRRLNDHGRQKSGPVDVSSGSKIAAEYALALASGLRATVTLFHVYEKPDLVNTIVPGADNAADDERDKLFAGAGLKHYAPMFRDGETSKCSWPLSMGPPASAIGPYSRTGDFATVVTGTDGWTGLRYVLMGSVAEAVGRRAFCPVMTIHFPVPGRAA
jgi:nucleotide-binding universal stress UspA family protein